MCRATMITSRSIGTNSDLPTFVYPLASPELDDSLALNSLIYTPFSLPDGSKRNANQSDCKSIQLAGVRPENPEVLCLY